MEMFQKNVIMILEKKLIHSQLSQPIRYELPCELSNSTEKSVEPNQYNDFHLLSDKSVDKKMNPNFSFNDNDISEELQPFDKARINLWIEMLDHTGIGKLFHLSFFFVILIQNFNHVFEHLI